jgi:ParB family chromosome partitioning protein
MTVKRKGLGRGLEALLESAPQREPSPTSFEVELGRLQPNRLQPRSRFDQDELQALAESIRAQGIIQPIIVVRDGDGFRIVAGERRWRAARLANLRSVPIRVVEVADERALLELALVENLQRTDLNPLEEAEAYEVLRQRFGLSQDEIANRVGKSRPAVTNALRLLRLAPEVQDLLRGGALSAGQARPLLSLQPASEQIALAREAARDALSARELEARVAVRGQDRVRGSSPRDQARSALAGDVHRRTAEERLVRALQTKVEIRRMRSGRGTIRLHFHSEEELMRLYDLLVGTGGNA